MSLIKRRKRRSSAFSTGAAMADMAFLLLIFFMASTTTEPPKGVEVELPTAVTEGAEQDSIYITIGADGRIFFEGEEVTLETLKDKLDFRVGEKDRAVAITADKSLSYIQVSAVLQILREKDFLNVLFMAQPKNNSSAEQKNPTGNGS